MSVLTRLIRWLRPGHAEAPVEDPEKLRTAFSARYHSFKLLLGANSKALEVMADLEHALRGEQPFGMSFVRASCTAVAVNVTRMVRHLDELAPGRYAELGERLRGIQATIAGLLGSSRCSGGGQLVLPLAEVDTSRVDEVGSKMAALGEVGRRMGFAVPPGFIATASAYHRFLEHNDLQTEIDRRLQAHAEDAPGLYALSAELQQLIIRGEVPADLAEAISQAAARLEQEIGRPVRLSVRSSALGEDAPGVSFAGQYRSELNVSSEHLLDAYKEVIASKYSVQAMTYRRSRGIPDESVAMCVGFMAMVEAVAGGVIYSSDPVGPDGDVMVVNAGWGLPKAVVDGTLRPDLVTLSRTEPPQVLRLEAELKPYQLVCNPEEGVGRESLDEIQAMRASLNERQAVELAELALELERHFGASQDIEWALARDGTLVVLQARPLHRPQGGRGPVGTPPPGAEVLADEGVSASPGVAFGPAFQIVREADLLRFPAGAVLVAAQPLPRWASVLDRAAAVVTEHGGVTGHLASVARELGVPALLGVARAMTVVADGRDVTVDADGCRVYAGKVEELLERRASQRRPIMEGTPVHEILKQVTRQIIPLNLLDPSSPEFKPASCQTLQDITRFCHEKSVEEMFRFGRDHAFSERAAKRLVTDVPMQLWVINLDDGFREEVRTSTVELGNIQSVPMLAIWEGMQAVPWHGPPPVDARGLLSVMFQATVNPQLDPALTARLADRNYFLVSRYFANVQSRFGFHFSTIEALVSDRAVENYVTFLFKGGAADFNRRLARVHFVCELLEEHGFAVRVVEDSLRARLEGREAEFMASRLRLLGYLIIHTRQLDMIMSNQDAFAACRARMQVEVGRIVDGSG